MHTNVGGLQITNKPDQHSLEHRYKKASDDKHAFWPIAWLPLVVLWACYFAENLLRYDVSELQQGQ